MKISYQIRRRRRHVVSYLLVLSLILSYLLLDLAIGMSVGLLSGRMILEYTRKPAVQLEQYHQLTEEMQLILDEHPELGLSAEQVVEFDPFLIAISQHTEMVVMQESDQDAIKDISDQLKPQLEQYLTEHHIVLTEKAELGLDKLLHRIQSCYEKNLVYPFVDGWVSFHSQIAPSLKQLSLLIAGISLMSVLMLINIQHYKKKGIRYVSYAIGAASIVSLLVIGSMSVLRYSPQGQPVFLYLWDKSKLGSAAAGIVGLLSAICLYVISKMMKK